MKRTIYTVQPVKGGGWDLLVRRPVGPACYVGGVTQTKAAQVKVGRECCRALWAAGTLAQLRIKGRNGRIQTEATYGRDPRRTPG